MRLEQKLAQAYGDALFDTDREAVIAAAEREGLGPEDVVFSVVLPTMEQLMNRSEAEGSISLAQHFLASQISSEVVERMLPLFKQAPLSSGRVMLGTALGDFHGLGKRIVAGCLKARMFEVTDLGMSVTDHRFVDEAVRLDAQVIGISSMMVHTATGQKAATGVRALLKERGLEHRIVGGAPYLFDEKLYRAVGADAWARNGLEAAQVVARSSPAGGEAMNALERLVAAAARPTASPCSATCSTRARASSASPRRTTSPTASSSPRASCGCARSTATTTSGASSTSAARPSCSAARR